MVKLGITLDFSTFTITVDGAKIQTRLSYSFMDTNDFNHLYKDYVEATSMHEAMHHVVKLLDTNIEKANLAKIMKKYSTHPSKPQREKAT